jgi:uncharacterized protein
MSRPAEAPATALVTGASSGIGLELARCFAKDGHRLIMVAHDRAKLDRAAAALRAESDAEIHAWSIDLAQPEGGAELHRRAQMFPHEIGHLVLNAGSGAWGDFTRETDLALEMESIQVNIVSVVQAAKRFLPDMVARESGRVLITSSVVAFGPSPRLAVYSGTKAFLYAFAEAVREELVDTEVTVTALMPDLTESDFFERAGVAPDSLLAQQPKADPAVIAKAGYEAMLKGKDHVITPSYSKLRAAAASILPAKLVTKMARAE